MRRQTRPSIPLDIRASLIASFDIVWLVDIFSFLIVLVSALRPLSPLSSSVSSEQTWVLPMVPPRPVLVFHPWES